MTYYDFQRTEEGCSDVNSLMVYVDGGRPFFVFIPNPKCDQDFNEKTILETHRMPEKALKMLFPVMSMLLLNLREVSRQF